MAVDQFGNILTPEEEEELRQHQIRMGVMPAALPPTAPFGGGIGLSNYKGNYGPYVAPLPFTPEPIVPNEPFTIPQLASTTPTWDTSAVSNVPQFDPTGGLAATDPNLQGVTPMSMASTGLSPQADTYEKTAHDIGTGIMDAFGIDTQQHMDNVGMINKLSQSDMLDVPTGWTNEMYAAGLKAQDFVQSGANPLLAMAGSYPYQAATEAFRATVDPTISYEEAMNMAAAQGLGGLIGAAGGLPAFEGPIGELIDDTVEKNVLGITTPDVTPNMWDTSAISTQSALDPNLQGTTPFSMASATGNLAGYGTSTPGMLEHQMGLNIDQPNTRFGDPYWDSDRSVQILVDEDVAAEIDDFSEIAPVDLDTYGKYKSDTGWHQGDWKGTASKDFENWQLERLPTLTTTTPTMDRVREQEAIAAGNIASETAGGLDRIARERIANQAAIEQQMKDDAARMEQQRKDAQKALNDARILARKKENARLNAAKREMLQERREEEAAARAAAREIEIANAQAAKDRVRQAKSIMNSKAYNESGLDGLTAAQRDIVAAAQVDTFNEITRRATEAANDRATVAIDASRRGGGPF